MLYNIFSTKLNFKKICISVIFAETKFLIHISVILFYYTSQPKFPDLDIFFIVLFLVYFNMFKPLHRDEIEIYKHLKKKFDNFAEVLQ